MSKVLYITPYAKHNIKKLLVSASTIAFLASGSATASLQSIIDEQVRPLTISRLNGDLSLNLDKNAIAINAAKTIKQNPKGGKPTSELELKNQALNLITTNLNSAKTSNYPFRVGNRDYKMSANFLNDLSAESQSNKLLYALVLSAPILSLS